jgi:hypothetical protein
MSLRAQHSLGVVAVTGAVLWLFIRVDGLLTVLESTFFPLNVHRC